MSLNNGEIKVLNGQEELSLAQDVLEFLEKARRDGQVRFRTQSVLSFALEASKALGDEQPCI